MRSTVTALFFALVVTIPAVAAAQTFSVEARLSSDTVEEGTTFTYSVTAATQGRQDVGMSEPPDFGAFRVVGQQQIPQFININGVAQRRLTLSYSLRAAKTGKYEIAGPEFTFGKETARANPVTVTVVPPGKVPRPTVDRSSGYFIETKLQPNRDPWVGEQIVLAYELYADATQMDTVARQLVEPELNDFWIEDLSDRTSGANQVISIDGRLMERTSLRTYALFPLDAGPVTIQPIEVELVVGSFFRRGRDVRVASKPIELEVRPLPPDAPKSFYEGNVGNWSFRVTSDQSATRVGRAIQVELAVSGDGQLGRLEVPRLPEISGARLSGPEEVTQPRVTKLTVGGVKKAVYTLTPLREGTLQIPPIEFSWFDPAAGKYFTSQSEPIVVRVAPGHLPPEPVPESDIARRTLAGGEDMVDNLREKLGPPRLSISLEGRRNPSAFGWWWWVLGVLSFAGFVIVATLPGIRAYAERRAPLRARKATRDAALARLESAGADPDAITAAIRDFLHEVHDVPRGIVTAAEIRRGFSRRGLPEEVAAELADVLEQCEQARFSPEAEVSKDLAARAHGALSAMPWRAPNSDGKASRTAASLVLLAAAAAAIGAAPDASAAQDDVAAAVAALEAAKWDDALPPLNNLAAEHPYAVDVLFDLGTAAAHAEEYGLARWALERAAWLAPFDSEVTHNRDVVARIVRLEAIEISRTGRTMDGDEALFWWRIVSSIPPWAYGLTMSLGWLLAAGLLALRRRDDRPAVRDAAFVGIVIAICIAVSAVFATVARASLVESAEPVVVTGPLELRKGPNAAAALERVPASMVPGTLLRVSDRRGVWVKLAWPGGSGWTSSPNLRPVR